MAVIRRSTTKEDPWEKYEKEAEPNMFEKLKLAQDGGFSEVKDLYAPSRWISAAMLLLFVIYNVEYITTLDIGFINDPNDVDGYTREEIAKINGDFYLTRGLYTKVFELINVFYGQDVIDVGKIKPVQVLGLFELIGISVYIFLAVQAAVQIFIYRDFKRWDAAAKLFWDWLPMLSVYSAMKLLDKIVPSKFAANLSLELAEATDLKALGFSSAQAYKGVVAMFFKTVACFLVGFDIFLLKLRIVNTNAGRPSVDLNDISAIVLLLVQLLGVVQLGPFVRQRIFIFIFAGEDGILQEHEKALMNCWNALLARKIYREFSFHQFLAVMLSFSDEDFQKLVLNEEPNDKRG